MVFVFMSVQEAIKIMEFLDYEGLKQYNENIQNLIEQNVQSTSNNLEIGGRNLLARTHQIVSNSANITSVYNTNDEIPIPAKGNLTYVDLAYVTPIVPNGTEYILTFEAKSNKANAKIHSHWYNPNTTTSSVNSQGQTGTAVDGQSLFTLTTEWKKYWVKWKQSETTAAKNCIVSRNLISQNGTDCIVYVRNVKLEQGNKATAWSPAPEDIDAAINSKLSLSGGQMTGPISFPTATQGDRVLLKDGDNDYNLLTYTLTGMKVRDTLYPENNTANLGRISNYWNNGYVNTLYSYQINAEDSLSITAINNLVLSSENESLIINANDVISNTVIYAPAFYETSDIRKKDIKSDIPLSKCYELIDKCQTIIYSLKDQTQEQVGMIAQEIEEFFPEVVATDKDGFKSLAYDRLVVICFKVLKDVIKRLEKLENAE